MKPKKTLLDAAIADGSMDRLNILLSASQILHCIANNFIEEASDIMLEHGLMLGMLKKRHTDLTLSADRYFKEFAGMITEQDKKMDMFRDMEELEIQIREWAKVPEVFKSNKS